MYDIVIPLNSRPDNNNDELKIALRSIERNIDWCRRVYIAGSNFPDWLITVGIIPCIDLLKTGKGINIANKLLMASLHPDVSENFIFWSDDQVALNPVDPKKLNIYNSRGKDKFNSNSNWDKQVRATFNALEKNGISLSYNWEAHTPCLHNKKDLITILSSSDYMSGDHLCVNTWVLGLTKRPPEIPQTSIKLTAEISTPANGWNLATCDKSFLGYNDIAFSTGLREELFNLFPDKSKYER